jgi:hypothetical protein
MVGRSIHASFRPVAIASLLLGIALALVACGSLGGLPGRVEQPQIVTTQEINRYPEDSPVRTVLRWWRALQFGSAELATSYYSPRLGLEPKDIERGLKVGPSLLNLNAGLRVVEVEDAGRGGAVLVMLTKKLRHPNGRTDVERTPVAFELVKQDGRWLLANNDYIDRILRNVRAFVEQGSAKKRKK